MRPPYGPRWFGQLPPVDLAPEYRAAFDGLPDRHLAGQIGYLQRLQRHRGLVARPQAVRTRRWGVGYARGALVLINALLALLAWGWRPWER